MLHCIESEKLRVTVSNTGAELQSIYSKKTGDEYLWQGDLAYWPSRAPVLFPIVGGLKNGSYQYGGKTYALSKHGFVRGAYLHRVEDKTDADNCITLEYVDNPATRTAYPFLFTLRVIFMLRENTLDISYHVINETKGEMLFSTGAHEGFKCPRHADENFNDYYLELEHDDLYESDPVSVNGLLADNRFTVIDGGRLLPLTHQLFENDALIFSNIKSKKVAIKSKKSPAVIEITYESPHLAIWTKPGAPYVCIEPWCGLPDHEETTGTLTDKKGIIRLGEGEDFTFKHTITIIEP